MNKFRPRIAEAIGTFALIFIGIGAIKAAPNDLLAIAFAHGLTIAVFVSATSTLRLRLGPWSAARSTSPARSGIGYPNSSVQRSRASSASDCSDTRWLSTARPDWVATPARLVAPLSKQS